MKSLLQLAIILLLGAALPALAQVERVLPDDGGKQAKLKGNLKAGKGKALANDVLIDRLLAMNERERRQALEMLAPGRRVVALRLLRQMELLSPDERQVLRGRYQLFFGLPVPRQRALTQEIRALRALPRPERRRALASDDLRSRFSEEEVQLLYEVMGLPEP